jgi:hypothetical protein
MAEVARGVATMPNEKAGADESFVADSQRGEDVQSPGPPIAATAANQNEEKVRTENENVENSNGSDDGEIEYPGRLTKVAVGFSLSLAVFLV